MGRLLLGAAVLLVTVLGAITTALFSLELPSPLPGTLTVENWTVFDTLATKEASARRRVLWSETAFGALPPERALYFVRTVADNGRDLEGGCRYRITGMPPDTSWWSLTVYDSGLGSIKSDGPAAINPDNVQLEDDGGYTAYISAVPEPGNWLSNRTGNTVLIVYRIYEPSKALLQDLRSARLPSVAQSGGCA